MHLKFKGEGPTRRYECEYYTVDAPPTSCFFCSHLTDIWFDYTNGPYMFLCDIGHTSPNDPVGLDNGMLGACPDFTEEEGSA